MKMQMLPTETTVGTILCHNIDDGQGGKACAKGHIIQAGDVARLQALGLQSVYVVTLDAGDVHEDAAATRLAQAVMAGGVEATRASTGRINLLAQHHGVVTVKPDALQSVNSIDGLTVATLPRYGVVGAGKIAATVKIIPYAVSDASLKQAEAIGQAAGGIVGVRPLREMKVAIILTGSAAAREKVTSTFEQPLRERVQALGSQPQAAIFVAEEPKAIAQALSAALKDGAGMVIIAGQTSIMDKDDITPQGIRLGGGAIEHYGVPVEPGNLLLLAYAGAIPVLGAPGCARSRQTNVIDLVLPRLLSGEHMTRQDLIALGNGGLL